MPKLIILDTNFLMIPSQFKVDIFSEIGRICNFSYKTAVLDRTVGELERIKSVQKGKNRLAAAFALQLLKKKDLKIIRTNSKKPTDNLIAEYGQKGAIIATQDSALRNTVREKKGRTIFLRSKRFLVLE